MKFCVITNVPLSTPNGISRYIKNLLKIYSLGEEVVYDISSLTDKDIDYINKTFDFVSAQMGVLSVEKGEGYKLQKLKNIKIKKIATIHTVSNEEVKYLKQCLSWYYPTVAYKTDELHSDRYEKFFLTLLDGLIFNTDTDRSIFNTYFKVKIPTEIIRPSIQYILDNIYSSKITKSKKLAYLGRVDYRKGILCSLNSMELLKDYILNVYGPVDKYQTYNGVILQHFLSKLRNINYFPSVSNRQNYYDSHFIFLGNSLYEPFGFSHVENLFNNVVPIIGKNTGTEEVFGKEYPYTVGDSVPELVEMVRKIENTDLEELEKVLDVAKKNLEKYNDEYFKENYTKFCKNIIKN